MTLYYGPNKEEYEVEITIDDIVEYLTQYQPYLDEKTIRYLYKNDCLIDFSEDNDFYEFLYDKYANQAYSEHPDWEPDPIY